MDSTQHLKQYCDHIGVTDKYTGFRHNLNRGSRNPVNLAYTWMKNTPSPPCPPPPIAASWSQPARPATTGHISTSSDYTPSKYSMSSTPHSCLLVTACQASHNRSHQLLVVTIHLVSIHITKGGHLQVGHLLRAYVHITINPRFKPRGLINFMVHNHSGSNRERGQIKPINLSNLLIWMSKLTQV